MLGNILPPTPSIVTSFIVDPFEEYKSNFLRISSPISNLQIIFIAIQIDDVRSRTSVSTTYEKPFKNCHLFVCLFSLHSNYFFLLFCNSDSK